MDAQNGSVREMKPFSFLKKEQRKQIKNLGYTMKNWNYELAKSNQ